jgi:ribulose-5-phosphate 4-epimerase/fuculose-1-phosphate aldolase
LITSSCKEVSFADMIQRDLQASADLFAWTLRDAGGSIDRSRCPKLARLGSETFLITSEGIDMLNLSVDDNVVVRSGHNDYRHVPSRYASIHEATYESSAELIAIIGSNPPNLIAFAATHREISNFMLTST